MHSGAQSNNDQVPMPVHWPSRSTYLISLIYCLLNSWDNSPFEKAHLQFCKRYLDVHKEASNMASRAKLGKYPMIIDFDRKILNYLSYLQNKDNNSIV